MSNLESEKYLIQVEGVWRPLNTTSNNGVAGLRVNNGCGPSAGMKRVLTKKFVVPKRVIPNFEEQRRMRMEKENKRRRVLQPGELERMYSNGGGTCYGGYSQDGGCNQNYGSTQPNGNQQQCFGGQNGLNDGYVQNNGLHNGFVDNGYQQQNGLHPQNGYHYQEDGNSNGNPNGENRNLHQSNGGLQRSVDQTTQNGAGPMAFQSNGMDARGFYQEEEDEEEDGDLNTGHHNSSNEQEMMNTQMNNHSGYQNNNERYHQNSNYQYHQNNNNQCLQNEDSNNEVNSDQQQPQSEQTPAYNQSPDDQQVTDELLALLGVTTTHQGQSAAAAAPTQKNGPSNTTTNNQCSYNNSNTQNNTNCADNSSNNQATKSSFLAGLEEAEDDLDDDQPVAFDFNRQDSYDDGPDNFDDESFNGNDDGGASGNNNEAEDATEKSAQIITGLSLPDPGESSSDEDSLVE
jgi:hypothetical protein